MAGLLGDGWEDPRSSAIMALAGGLLQGNPGAGLLGANSAYGQAKQDAMRQQYISAQMQNMQAEAEARKLKMQQEQAEIERQARLRQAIPGLFQQPGMTGGQPQPQTEGGIPMFSKPMGVTPMQPTAGAPGGFNVQEAIRLGMTPEQISAYAGLQDLGRPKATRQMEVDDGKGGKRIALVDDFGREVAGFAGYTAPVQVNQGNQISFVKPAPGMALPVGMSPSERDASARGWAGHNLSTQRLQLDRENAGAGKIPAGYRLAANGQGLEFIPGGPADPNAAKRAAPTEFQGKSAIYGTRAQESDRIIQELEGKYSPAAVNAKSGVAGVPLIGGALEAVANMALSSSGQKAEQAQRDFINAVLRQESGAVISEPEFANARKQYFPQPFDSAAVKAQKAANRKLAIQGILNNARANGAAPPAPNTGGATGSFGDDPLGLRK